MSTTVALDEHAKRIREYLEKADKLDIQPNDCRLKAGRELKEARCRVDAGETNLSWSAWCARYVKRSDRDIRRLMALAGADDPAEAREREKARNRNAKPPGSRSASPFQAHDEGVGAYLRGLPQTDCPYNDRRRHAAWRKGWSETEGREGRTGASPPVSSEPGFDGGQLPLAELRQAIEKCWPLLSRADQ